MDLRPPGGPDRTRNDFSPSGTGDRATREELLKYLADLQKFTGDYHNHKELLGWAAALLYLIISLGFGFGGQAPTDLNRIVFSVLLPLVLLSVIAYARRQWNLREYAARIVWTCYRLTLNILAGDLQPSLLAPEALRPGPPELHGSSSRDDCWLQRWWHVIYPPRFNDERNADVLPPAFIDEMKTQKKDETIKSLEGFIVLLMLLATIAAIARAWS